MRLIDADAFNSWLEGYAREYVLGKRKISITNILIHVRDMPTIQTERKRAKWEDCRVNGWRCSNCRYEVARYNNTAFCPNCGFDMRYKKEEDDNV